MSGKRRCFAYVRNVLTMRGEVYFSAFLLHEVFAQAFILRLQSSAHAFTARFQETFRINVKYGCFPDKVPSQQLLLFLQFHSFVRHAPPRSNVVTNCYFINFVSVVFS